MLADNQEVKAGQAIGHYEIVSALGRGGMGEVYLAHDTKLGRRVALKFMTLAFGEDPDSARRFEQEARAASGLNHPNIVTIHEIGEVNNRRFIATEFIDGETLRQRLTPIATQAVGGAERIETTEAISIAEQVASALAAAHANGIVHRDIKPENIMLRRDGIAKVLDFGLAKFAEAKPGGPEDLTREMVLTNPGVVMGTMSYMSPEQARALPVDARTDIWSLGVVLYEMLAGTAPFAGPSSGDVLVSILDRELKPLAHSGRNFPETLEFIVSKALTKDREDRYQTARELLADLRRINSRIINLNSGQGPAPPTTSVTRQINTSGSSAVAPSIGVLPFVNMSTDPENEYFCDGLAEEVINALTKIENLFVVARTSAFSFKGKELDVREIGRRLNVANVLEGSVRKAGNRLRITAQLISVEDGYHLWSERYDRELADVFAIQDEITLAIVEKLKVKLLRGERAALFDRYRDNVEAYNLCLKGRHYWNQRPLGIMKAIEYFEQAIAMDANYALAYSGLADCYSVLGSWENGTLAPAVAMPKAKAAAEKALTLDIMLVEAHASLAFGQMHYDWDWDGTAARFRHANDINPHYPTLHHWHSHYLMAMGDPDGSLTASKRFLELDPLDMVANIHLAWHHVMAHQFEDAIEQCFRSKSLFPNSFWPYFCLGLNYEHKGLIDESRAEFEQAIKIGGDVTFAYAGLGHLHATSGERAKAENVIATLTEMSKTRYVPSFDIALIYAGLGELDNAFVWLEKSYQERSSWMAYLNVEPRLDPLRPDPRFADLLQRVGLASIRKENPQITQISQIHKKQ